MINEINVEQHLTLNKYNITFRTVELMHKNSQYLYWELFPF